MSGDEYRIETVDPRHLRPVPDPVPPPDAPPDEREVSIPPRNRATAQPPPAEPPPLAYEQRILDRFRDEVRLRGLVGEEATAQRLYLVFTSRLLDKQVSAAVKGHSSSGKSYTVETVTRFLPREAFLEFTAMSERALVYSQEKFQHRTLVVYEVVALREGVEDDLTSYFVRSLLSEGRIEYEVTERRDGSFTTRKIVKEGPTNLVFTTTKTRVHAENETRVLSLSTDDSREQTARVLVELANEGNGGGDLEPWLQLQRWLQQHGERRVTIPYARALAERVPPVAVRLRRDFGAILALVRAHAVLHQRNRDRDPAGRIVATLEDYTVVRDLIADVVAEGVGATVADTVRETVGAVAALADDEGVQARAIAERLGLDKSNVSRRLRMAADGGYLRNLEDKRGRPGRWVVGDPLPETVDLLPQPHNLTATPSDAKPAGQDAADPSGCAVALASEGERTALTEAAARYGLDEPTAHQRILALAAAHGVGYAVAATYNIGGAL